MDMASPALMSEPGDGVPVATRAAVTTHPLSGGHPGAPQRVNDGRGESAETH